MVMILFISLLLCSHLGIPSFPDCQSIDASYAPLREEAGEGAEEGVV